MKYVVGIAPSGDSVRDEHNISQAWCPDAECGKRVRLLVGQAAIQFANASNKYPGSYTTRSGRKKDRKPPKKKGLHLLESLSKRSTRTDPVDILLLGLGYWKAVAEKAERSRLLVFTPSLIPVGKPISLLNHSANVGSVYLLPHPRWWPMAGEKDQATYRAETLVALDKGQRVDKSTGTILGKDDYDRVFAQFGF